MMVEDLGVEAKESVVRKVAKLMCLLKLLQSINSIKADYITHQQVLLFMNFHHIFQFLCSFARCALNFMLFFFFQIFVLELCRYSY
ncbi:hypothetical protein IC582_005638 [Cucumis melo]